jgi:hypothetical protein
VAQGCPDGRYEGYSHRVSAAALQTRGLVKIAGRGTSWNAEITPRGTALLELPDPPAPVPREPRKKTEKPEPRPRALSKTEQLIADLVEAGGTLRVPYWPERGQPNYRQRAMAAERFNKVPSGKRLVMHHVRGGQLEIRLEDEIPGTALGPVTVPARLSRPHSVAVRFRDDTDRHQISRAALPRSVRIIHALVTEAERRGHTVAYADPPHRDRSARGAKAGVAHIVISVGHHPYSLGISEENVILRGVWEERRRENERYQQLYLRHSERMKPYDSGATGSLTISLLNPGYRREGRVTTWSDRKSWTLESKLPELLHELEIRAVEDDEREAEEKREAEQRRRAWDVEMERAKVRFMRAHRAKVLRDQVAARQEAQLIATYLADLEKAHGDSPEAAEWIEWIRDFVTRLDPLSSPPGMPPEPEISREEMKPYLPPGVSPYGPDRW